MAVAVEANFPGATTEQYDEEVKAMGLTSGGAASRRSFPLGDEDRLRCCVTDVWESKEQFERFAQEQISRSEQVGLPEPEIRYIDVHAYMVGG